MTKPAPKELIAALENHDIDRAKALLEQGADPNARDSDGRLTALMCAANENYPELAELLLDHGADIDLRDPGCGFTALMYAVMSAKWLGTDVVRLLIERGADLDVEAHFNQTVIDIARFERQDVTDEVRKMLKDGKSRQRQLRNKKASPGELIKAVSSYDPHYNSDIDLVRIVLDAGANPNGRDRKTGETPLHIAVKNDNTSAGELVQLLIERGANLEATTKAGDTPLMYAASYDNIPALNLLLEKGVSLDKKNLSARDALDCAKNGYVQWIGHGYIPRSSTINAPVSEAVEILTKVFNEKAAREAAETQKTKIAELHNTASERQNALKNLRPQPKPRTP